MYGVFSKGTLAFIYEQNITLVDNSVHYLSMKTNWQHILNLSGECIKRAALMRNVPKYDYKVKFCSFLLKFRENVTKSQKIQQWISELIKQQRELRWLRHVRELVTQINNSNYRTAFNWISFDGLRRPPFTMAWFTVEPNIEWPTRKNDHHCTPSIHPNCAEGS